MSNPLETDDRAPHMTGLVKGIVEDLQILIRQEFELAKAEMKDQGERAAKGAAFFGVALAFTLFALALLTLTGVHLLAWLTGWPLWTCYGLVGGICILIAAAAAGWAYDKVKRIRLIPPQTAETMKENVRWLQNQT
jgi:uncharacterized membrane protein YqjE